VGTFGPWYPGALQSAVSHAERVADLFASRELSATGSAGARARVLGRAAEIACFVQSVVDDWRRGRLDVAAAALAIDDYLASLHDGFVAWLGLRHRPCCELPETVRPLPPAVGRSAADNFVVVIPLSELFPQRPANGSDGRSKARRRTSLHESKGQGEDP
jgi:hypothetical protein